MKQEMFEGHPVDTANIVCDIASILSQIETRTDDYYIHKLIADARKELGLIQEREEQWVEATGYFTPEQYAGEHS